MEVAIQILIAIIALLHCYIMWFEMFAWETKGKKNFKTFPSDLFPKTKTMAGNQGLYNGFLSVGLLWTFFINDVVWKSNIALFFLSCIAVAGIYGAFTASKKILFVQTIPALITIVLILFYLQIP
ncbi:LOW QUALITY PROTEIN: putative membrane protein [Galbibacter orientalis DSM 19592]|uniref:Putative membrane protein n=1 Tax=Galbibacter orientalis DSM 19592 TaxID=926559 RepID=I3C192_9FLAO|nr:LOW QUALITY PROTEIN: putative membrane protein [Galbibacter orientalis DSM 19592]